MTSPVKWIFFSLLFMMIVLGIAYASSVQNIATRTTGEIDVLSDIEKIGVIRKGLNENGEASEQLEYVDVEELIARFFSDVVDVQKKLNYDIQLDFVFLDEAGNMTKNENEVRSIQYRLQYLNDKGEVKGTAEGRQELHQLGSAIAGGSGKTEVKSAYFTSTESPSAEQTETFEINGLKNILSISSNTGTVEVVKVEGNKVTVRMKNGEVSRSELTGEVLPGDRKWVSFTTNWDEEYERISNNDFNVDTTTGIEPPYEGKLTRTYTGVPVKEISYRRVFTSFKTFISPKKSLSRYVYKNDEWIEDNVVGSSDLYDYQYDEDEEGYLFERMSGYNPIARKSWYNMSVLGSFGDIASVEFVELDEPIEVDERILIQNPKEGDLAEHYSYQKYHKLTGLAFLGGRAGAEWTYEGWVTAPESDNRTWEDYYQYDLVIEYE